VALGRGGQEGKKISKMPRHICYIPLASISENAETFLTSDRLLRHSSDRFGNVNSVSHFHPWAARLGSGNGSIQSHVQGKARADEDTTPLPRRGEGRSGEQGDVGEDWGMLMNHNSDHQWLPLRAFAHRFWTRGFSPFCNLTHSPHLVDGNRACG